MRRTEHQMRVIQIAKEVDNMNGLIVEKKTNKYKDKNYQKKYYLRNKEKLQQYKKDYHIRRKYGLPNL